MKYFIIFHYFKENMETHILEFPIYPKGDPRNSPHVIDDIPEFPELTFYYLEGRNSLCPGDTGVVCFWEGDLAIKLEINGHILELNDHDEKRGDKYQIIINSHKYTFQGIAKWPNPGPIVYIRIRITKELLSTLTSREHDINKVVLQPKGYIQPDYNIVDVMRKADRRSRRDDIVYPDATSIENRLLSSGLSSSRPLSPPRRDHPKIIDETIVKKLGQPFIIELSANASTGYKWILDPLVNLKIVYSGYWSACEGPVPGCGGYDYYLLVGTKKGTTTFSGKYVRSWEPASSSDTHKVIHITIV
jgi:predicted secreted protein